jgi:signal transduction histidine kinase
LLAGLAIGYLFVQTVERNVRVELLAAISGIVAVLDTDSATPRLLQHPADPRYDIPLSGYYWQIAGGGSAPLRSASLWDFALSPHLADGDSQTFERLAGPNAQTLSAMTRRISVPTSGGEASYLVTVAADRSVIDQSIEQFGTALVVALAILGLALMVAAYLQVRLGLAPLDGLRSGIEAIRLRDKTSMVGEYPREVQPLVSEIDALLASQGTSIEFARQRAADLAHGLKTPLAVLGHVAEALRAEGQAEKADEIDMLSHEMLERVEYQLHLSRLRHPTRQHLQRTSLDDALTRTLSVVERTHAGEALEWILETAPLTVDIDGNDLIELLGVLLENAGKWARSTVWLSTRAVGDVAEIIIADDGPGLDDDQLAALGQRGQRFDEIGEGHGLGVAIATNIVALNRGTISFGRSANGGLEARLQLPLATGD